MCQIFWRFLRHIGTFVHHLGGVDNIKTKSRGRALAPNNQAKFSKYIGEGEINISVSIRAACTNFFGRFLRHIETFLDQLMVLTHLWVEH